jgi:polysaccharide pyruvyl transferase WcaK-like protein
MAGADIAVVTRFHNLVCALHVGTPCVSLGYAGKNAALQEEMGLGRFSQAVETFDLEILKRHTEKLIAERLQHAAAITRKVADYEVQLKAQERILAEEFLAPAASVRVAAPARVNPQALQHPVAH